MIKFLLIIYTLYQGPLIKYVDRIWLSVLHVSLGLIAYLSSLFQSPSAD